MTEPRRYEPSPWEWVRDQVDQYERSGGTEGNTLLDTGLAVIVLHTVGRRSGTLRKSPLMKVEHDGVYALVASQGGAPTHPWWYLNLLEHPDEIAIQDGPAPFPVTVREIDGDEKALWWQRCVDAYPPYAEYQERTERVIPVLLAERR